ncbi:MAG: ATP-binding protein, partial [Clostridia bacterium]|nr:ATP-binding protein [Clostridia bacterium]
MIHGDYHTKNLELQGDEVLLIDMDTLAVGHPIFELASIYNSFIGYSEYDHETVKRFQGFDFDTSTAFFNKFLSAYLGTKNQKKLTEVKNKARIVGYARMIRRSIRRNGLESEEGRKEIELWKNELIELLRTTDTLLFVTNELEIEAQNDNLSKVLSFIEQHLEAIGCTPKIQMQISVAVEEIFVNIANYAYAPDVGKVTVRVEITEEPLSVCITFMDGGKPFDPTKRADPDVTLSAEERQIGGLGIFMTKKIMDDVVYEYIDGKNILTLKKGI